MSKEKEKRMAKSTIFNIDANSIIDSNTQSWIWKDIRVFYYIHVFKSL